MVRTPAVQLAEAKVNVLWLASLTRFSVELAVKDNGPKVSVLLLALRTPPAKANVPVSGITLLAPNTDTFAFANTYTGGTTLTAGTLQLGANNVIPDTGTFAFAGGVLNANNKTETFGPLSLTANSTLNLVNDANHSTLTFAS